LYSKLKNQFNKATGKKTSVHSFICKLLWWTEYDLFAFRSLSYYLP